MQIYRRISSYANDASLSRVHTDSFPLQLLYRLRTRTPDQPRAHPLSLRRLLNQRGSTARNLKTLLTFFILRALSIEIVPLSRPFSLQTFIK